KLLQAQAIRDVVLEVSRRLANVEVRAQKMLERIAQKHDPDDLAVWEKLFELDAPVTHEQRVLIGGCVAPLELRKGFFGIQAIDLQDASAVEIAPENGDEGGASCLR